MNRVSNPPPKPLLIWDGDCRFCELWIQRWRELSYGNSDDATSQQTAAQFPEIPPEQFNRTIVYIDIEGRVFTGADALFRSLPSRWSHRLAAWAYDHLPGFAGASEFAYGIIARNRRTSSAITRALWGKDVRRPTYYWAQRSFLRGLGVVYLCAFVSVWVQIDGLVGSNGILPVADFLTFAREQLGPKAMSLLPTLCWFNSENSFLHLLCGGGVLASLLLIAGLTPIVCLAALFILYLSLSIAGQTFFNFQWDILLLETGFLALFIAPVGLWLKGKYQTGVPRLGRFLLIFLLFKLMLMSGVVKLTSGDDCWAKLTALDYHYWSQPLPTVFAWFADKHPGWFKKFSVAFCLFVEIVVPFFMLAPRRLRLGAAVLLVGLQLAIAITGNYCFFNLLTIVLCLLLIDDASLPRWPSASQELVLSLSKQLRSPSAQWFGKLQIAAALLVLIITLPLNLYYIYSAFRPDAEMPKPIVAIAERLEPFRIANGYGLFRVMTKDRREIVIEGSNDGIDWSAYEFKWKPGEVNRMPGWCAPHQPRLDWQMWFAALSTAQQNRWFLRLIGCLLENKRDVIQLLANNPFPDSAPMYIRARFYRYRFTSSEERHRTGAWWKRDELAEYLPTVSLR